MVAPRPIRVMRLIARLNIGGPAIHVTLLTAWLRPPEFETLLVCGHIGEHEGDMAYLAGQKGIQPVMIAELGRELAPLRDLRTLLKLWRLMRRFRPDIVCTHTAKAGLVGRWAAWLARVPVRVHTFHGHVFHGYFGPAKTRLFLVLERLTARITDRLITISPALRDELVHTYHIAPFEKFVVVPLGLELDPFAATPRHQGQFRAEHRIPPAAPLIGIVGRLVPIKNHGLFVEMAARVRAARPEAHFVIIGDGETRAAVEQQVSAAGLSNAVTFTGWLTDLRPAYSDLDALVITSRNEGTPVSLIEALTAGVPVVSTAVGGVPDLLQGGAYGQLVPPDDPAALASAVLDALDDSGMDRAAVQQAVIVQYGIARLAGDVAALYRDLLADRRGARRA